MNPPAVVAPVDLPAGVEIFPAQPRDEWLRRRQADVTASTVGALFGAHEFVSPFGLFALKAGLAKEDVEASSPVIERGELLEPVALELLRRRFPDLRFARGTSYYRDGARRIGATPDAFCWEADRGLGVVQIKSVEPSIFRRKWIDEQGEIAPPVWVALQAIVEARLTGARWAAVAPMRIGFGIEIDLLPVELHDRHWRRVCEVVADFWRRVEANEPYPPDYGRDGALIARLNPIRDDAPPKDLSGDNELPALLDERAALTASAKAAKERLDAIKAEIIHKLGECSTGYCADGRMIVRKIQTRKEHVVKASTFEVLNVKEARP